MLNNDYIYTRCKDKIVRPSISIASVSLGNGSNYSKPYGAIYLPTPIIDFPVGKTFEICTRKTDFLNSGIPFKFFLPVGFDHVGVSLEVILSGDKYFRSVITILESEITPITENYYQTVSKFSFQFAHSLSQWKVYLNEVKLIVKHTKIYFRMRLMKNDYYSAWSEIGSFDYKVRFAETGVEGYTEDGTLITDEDGYAYDGTFYY